MTPVKAKRGSNFLRVDRLFERVVRELIEKHVGPETAKCLRPEIRRQASELRRFNPSVETVRDIRHALQSAGGSASGNRVIQEVVQAFRGRHAR